MGGAGVLLCVCVYYVQIYIMHTCTHACMYTLYAHTYVCICEASGMFPEYNYWTNQWFGDRQTIINQCTTKNTNTPLPAKYIWALAFKGNKYLGKCLSIYLKFVLLLSNILHFICEKI